MRIVSSLPVRDIGDALEDLVGVHDQRERLDEVARVERHVVGLADVAARRVELGLHLRELDEVHEIGRACRRAARRRCARTAGPARAGTSCDRRRCAASCSGLRACTRELRGRLGDLLEHELRVEPARGRPRPSAPPPRNSSSARGSSNCTPISETRRFQPRSTSRGLGCERLVAGHGVCEHARDDTTPVASCGRAAPHESWHLRSGARASRCCRRSRVAEAASRGGLGVVRLAELVGSDKSQTSRTLATLAEHGLVERDPDTLSYRIGWQVFALAARAGEPRLLAAAPRLLRGLVQQLGESAHLSVRQGASVLTLLSESPASAIHAPGARGRADAARHHLGRPRPRLRPGRDELATPSGLADDRRAASPRRARWLRDRARGVRAGPRGGRRARARRHGRIVAAVNVSAPAFRFADRLDEAAAAVVAAAAELSAELGAPRQSAA